MTFPQRLLWKAYLILALMIAVDRTYHLLAPRSPQLLYYLILRAFEPVLSFTYGMHILNVWLNVTHCLPLTLYIYRIRFLSPVFWQNLFIFRCIFEIAGNPYHANRLSALYQTDKQVFWIAAALMALPHIPSYLACYRYAFRQNALFSGPDTRKHGAAARR